MEWLGAAMRVYLRGRDRLLKNSAAGACSLCKGWVEEGCIETLQVCRQALPVVSFLSRF